MSMSNADNCVHCGQCTRKCTFLKKFNLDLAQFKNREDLAYHCFLCGKCKSVCPKDIDGRELALNLRRMEVKKNHGKLRSKEYKGLVIEKSPYKFANYRHGHKKSVLFPGCNFLSFYPKTTKYLTQLLEQYEIGVVYDCCQKPIEELGLSKEADTNISQINKTLRKQGVEEVIMLCPNCYHFLNGRLDVQIVTVYEKLKMLGLGHPIKNKTLPMYFPCPDREGKEMMQQISFFVEGTVENLLPDMQCCGLGGCARTKEPELAKEMVQMVKSVDVPMIYTYCASCISSFHRGGIKTVSHILPMILGVEEKITLDIRPFLNRAKIKWK